MTLLLALLTAYGICFGLMNDKAYPLTNFLRLISKGEGGFFDQMFSCSYCTGFHSGWITWMMLWLASGARPSSPLGLDFGTSSATSLSLEMLMFAFASTAFCYLVDTASQWLEQRNEDY